MTDEPFLIAHKVRNEPAFDIAIKQPCSCAQIFGSDGCDECEGLGYWWIVATSGHRAYPYWSEDLSELMIGEMFDPCNLLVAVPTMPEGIPDHYPSSASPKSTPIRSLLAKLGWGP